MAVRCVAGSWSATVTRRIGARRRASCARRAPRGSDMARTSLRWLSPSALVQASSGIVPAFVQSAYADSGSAAVASQNVSLPTPATAGNLVLGFGSSDATLTPSGISGMSVAASSVNLSGVYIWWKTAAGGEQTLTLTPSVSDTVCAGIIEYSGGAASPLDATAPAN